jgi:hypothetical protein
LQRAIPVAFVEISSQVMALEVGENVFPHKRIA